MRAPLLVFLSLSLGVPVMAQEFASPLDVVDTLYNGYLLQAPLGDISPYFSDKLTAQLNGLKIGTTQFEAAGIDPVTGFLNWQPRDLSIVLLSQSVDFAQVRVTFVDDETPAQISLNVVNEGQHGWQIDHIAGKAGQRTWCTNAIVSIAKKSSKTAPAG